MWSKRVHIPAAAALLAVLLATSAWAAGPPPWAGGGMGANLNLNFTGTSLSEAEQAAVAYMREEEKLARDVYQVLGDKWNSPIFQNIVQAEQRRMDAVAALLTHYGLSDPVADKAAGEFSSPEMQDLYNQLVEKGSQSLTEASRVGATIEDLDIYDLEQRLAQSSNPDLQTVFGNLMRGSENHLRAFNQQLTALGESYSAQYITPERLQEILSTPMQRGWRQ